MGWSIQPQLYRQTKELLAPHGTELYLWLPVFSENALYKEVYPLTDHQQKAVGNYSLNEGESFAFYCPNHPENGAGFLEIFEEHFGDLLSDGILTGVFLDRIRYASFINGLGGVFSCFCPSCMQKYAEAGVDCTQLLAEMSKVTAGTDGYDRVPLGINAYQSGEYRFDHPVWHSFFKAKQTFIYDALVPIVNYFKERGLRVGLDVFCPFAAYFVGQDIPRLLQLADFIKPMMYRATYAPAGIPFEYEGLINETIPEAARTTASDEYGRIIGYQRENNMPVDHSFVQKELALLSGQIYCGIEINYQPAIVPTTVEYVIENLTALSSSAIDGFVLSWDLLSAPDSHTSAVVRYACQSKSHRPKA
jgi:hypothetical protein